MLVRRRFVLGFVVVLHICVYLYVNHFVITFGRLVIDASRGRHAQGFGFALVSSVAAICRCC